MCLDGVFVECSLARFLPDGQAVVGSAGGARLLLRKGGAAGTVTCHTLTGMWLGLSAPDPENQGLWDLDEGDELVLATDGLYEQLCGHAGTMDGCLGRLAGHGRSLPIFESVRAALYEALEAGPQHDDITVVVVRRQAVAALGEALPAANAVPGDR